MDGHPSYWADANHHQENFADATPEILPPLTTEAPMTVWIPVYSPGLAVPPAMFQRPNTAPVQYSPDTALYPYTLTPNTDANPWAGPSPGPGASLQRSLSDPLWTNGAAVPLESSSWTAPDQDDEQPKKKLRKERRRSQNRKAQRAFRERKESRLRELEEELEGVNAKYDALENEHRHIKSKLLELMAEKQELEGTAFSPANTCSPFSPEIVPGSRRTSVADAAAEALLNDMQKQREEELSPRIVNWAAKLPTEAKS